MRLDGSRYGWWLVVLLFGCATLNYADRTALSSVFPLLRSDLGMSDIALGATGSLFLWSYALGSPLAGWCADRYSRTRLIVWSLAGWSVATALTGVAANANQLLATRALLGISECFYLPAAVALIAEYHPAGSRATAMGLHAAGLNFGMVAGGALGGYVGETAGWRVLFFGLGGAGLLMAVVAKAVLRPPAQPIPGAGEPREPAGPPEHFTALLRTPTYGILVVQAALIAVSTWVFSNWLPLYYRETFSMSLSGAGFSGTFLIQMSSTLGMIAGGVLSDRIAGTRTARRLLAGSSFYFAAAPFLLGFVFSRSYAVVSICVVFFAVFRGLAMANELPVLCEVLGPRLRSTGIGLMNTTNTLAGGFGTLFAGYLKRDMGLEGVFALLAVLFVAGGAMQLTAFVFFADRDLERRARAAGERA